MTLQASAPSPINPIHKFPRGILSSLPSANLQTLILDLPCSVYPQYAEETGPPKVKKVREIYL